MIPWAKLFRDLTLANTWPPQVIGSLTWYQAAMYGGAKTPDDGPRRISRDEALARGLVRLAERKQ